MKSYTNGWMVSPSVYNSKGIDAAIRLSAAANTMEVTYERMRLKMREKGFKESEAVFSVLWESWFQNVPIICPASWCPWHMVEVLGV